MKIFVWRLDLTCGHSRLWGPYIDGTNEKLIGEHVLCVMCPEVKRNGETRQVQFQLVVNVTVVDSDRCSPEWLRSGLS